MPALPAHQIGCLIGAGDRNIRRRAPRHPPRTEVREAPVGRSSSRAIDDGQRRRPRVRRESRRPRAVTPTASARTRFQSSRRTGEAPGSRMEERAAPDAGNIIADRSAGRAAARQRPECVLAQEKSRGRWADGAARGRCVHHRRHAERVRGRAATGRERSPSTRSQLVEAAA